MYICMSTYQLFVAVSQPPAALRSFQKNGIPAAVEHIYRNLIGV